MDPAEAVQRHRHGAAPGFPVVVGHEPDAAGIPFAARMVGKLIEWRKDDAGVHYAHKDPTWPSKKRSLTTGWK